MQEHGGAMPGLDPVPSVALVHDYLLVLRGAERTFATIAECWPSAPLYTLLYDKAGTDGRFAGREIHTSSLQRLGAGQRSFRALLPLFPWAVERLSLDGHDLVLSSSSAFAQGVRKPDGAVHICYCHSPFRYAWHERERALEEMPRPLRPLVGGVLRRVRSWDWEAAQRVDHHIANAQITRERIQRFYGRDAPVIHPPVDVARFRSGEPEDFFLVVGEVTRHKRTEVALEAARLAGVPIKVAGSGPDLERLVARYSRHAEFLGRVGDDALAALYARARALVVPNVEDFGIAAVEAQAAGRPVVALHAGGTAETVVDGETGVLLERSDPEVFAAALRDCDFDGFDPARIVAHAARFGADGFRRRLVDQVARFVGVDAAALGAVVPPEPGSPAPGA